MRAYCRCVFSILSIILALSSRFFWTDLPSHQSTTPKCPVPVHLFYSRTQRSRARQVTIPVSPSPSISRKRRFLSHPAGGREPPSPLEIWPVPSTTPCPDGFRFGSSQTCYCSLPRLPEATPNLHVGAERRPPLRLLGSPNPKQWPLRLEAPDVPSQI
jgi:hypothetical protein